MPGSSFSQKTITTLTTSQKACEDAWCEFYELKAATRAALTKSRELMTEIDAVLAKMELCTPAAHPPMRPGLRLFPNHVGTRLVEEPPSC
jgi:hypothetical protein